MGCVGFGWWYEGESRINHSLSTTPPSLYITIACLFHPRTVAYYGTHGIDCSTYRFEKEFDGVQDVFELQVSRHVPFSHIRKSTSFFASHEWNVKQLSDIVLPKYSVT